MPKVKHRILRWARENAKFSVEQAARKLQLTDSKEVSAVEKLVAYEEGDKDPSRPLLIRMSKLYHRPLLLFYLERPPKIGDRGEDFQDRIIKEGARKCQVFGRASCAEATAD